MAPAWYKSRSYRARTIREPRTVLAEFGLIIPEEVTSDHANYWLRQELKESQCPCVRDQLVLSFQSSSFKLKYISAQVSPRSL